MNISYIVSTGGIFIMVKNKRLAIDNVNINFTNLDRLKFTNSDQLSNESNTSLTLYDGPIILTMCE